MRSLAHSLDSVPCVVEAGIQGPRWGGTVSVPGVGDGQAGGGAVGVP